LAAIDANGADRTDRQRRGSIQAAAEFGRDAADKRSEKIPAEKILTHANAGTACRRGGVERVAWYDANATQQRSDDARP
jgi:hypothetical protein